MNERGEKPVVILAFSNDQDEYLPTVIRERKSIFKALQEYDDRDRIQVHTEENASIEDLFDLFNHYAGRVAIFHYGGHANGTQLQLETPMARPEMAEAKGLAQLLGQQHSLQLVFLNGCATSGQVKALFSSGVRAVIATSVPIDDEMATEFAEQFYHALAAKATLQRAFQTARAFVATRYGNRKEVGEFRGLHWSEMPEPSSGEVPWGLYVNGSGEEALAWTLPEVAEHQVILRAAPESSRTGSAMNTDLIATLFNSVAAKSPAIGTLWEAALQAKRQDLRTVRQQLIDSFPAPIGEHLRKLFAGTTIDLERLRQLVVAYETASELLCFAALSRFWDARFADPGLTIATEHLVTLNSFFALTAESQPTFPYIGLAAALAQILTESHTSPFLDEMSTLPTVLQEDPLATAHRFMEEMRVELSRGDVSAGEIESFCLQTEEHLGTILSALAFLVRYTLTTIKKIDIIKTRHKLPEYRHNQVVLDRVTAGIMDSEEIYPAFTDSESVILLKHVDDVKEYLSLSPFVIDENAFTGDQNSKLFLYSHFLPSEDGYVYRFADNPDDTMIVSETHYPQIKKQFEQFKAAVFTT
jgi:DNA-binding NarL/FixJ family response regulator